MPMLRIVISITIIKASPPSFLPSAGLCAILVHKHIAQPARQSIRLGRHWWVLRPFLLNLWLAGAP